jgi:hypothetical protein
VSLLLPGDCDVADAGGAVFVEDRRCFRGGALTKVRLTIGDDDEVTQPNAVEQAFSAEVQPISELDDGIVIVVTDVTNPLAFWFGSTFDAKLDELDAMSCFDYVGVDVTDYRVCHDGLLLPPIRELVGP